MRASLDCSHFSMTLGTTRSVLVSGASHLISRGSINLPWARESDRPWCARRQTPPYWPVSSSGVTTRGLVGSRCSTGGSLPSLTSCASSGASLKVVALGLAVGAALCWETPSAAAVGFDAAAGLAAAGATTVGCGGFAPGGGGGFGAGRGGAGGGGAPPPPARPPGRDPQDTPPVAPA